MKRGQGTLKDLSTDFADGAQKKHACAEDLRTGHRARLKSRFLRSRESLSDYELLEALLFLVQKRCDTKPIAKNLLRSFRSLAGVFSAEHSRLSEIEGLGPQGAHVIQLVQTLFERLLKEELLRAPLLDNIETTVRYLKGVMAHLAIEQFRVLFLDSKGALLDDMCQEGTVNQTTLYPREIMKKALQVSAASILLAHNHPSGYAKPSKADIDVTARIKRLCCEMGVYLADHLIIGKYEWYSFRASGLL